MFLFSIGFAKFRWIYVQIDLIYIYYLQNYLYTCILFLVYNTVYKYCSTFDVQHRWVMHIYLKLVTLRQKTCASFRTSFCFYELTSNIRAIRCQHIIIQICSKTCASLLPVFTSLSKMINIVIIVTFIYTSKRTHTHTHTYT